MGSGDRGGGAHGGLEIMGTIMELLGGLLGRKAEPDVVPRGFLGLEVSEDGEDAVVKTVLADGPADRGGLKPGDRFVKFKGRSVYGVDGLKRFTNRLAAGESFEVIVKRDGKEITLKVEAGEGL